MTVFSEWRARLAATAGMVLGVCLGWCHASERSYGDVIESRSVPGTPGSMAVELVGKRLYTLSAGGLTVYAVDEPKAPKLIGRVEGLGNVRQMAVRGNIAYVTARQDGLWIVDVSEPSAPQVLSHFETVELATGLDVAGDVAFVGLRVYGVQAIDVSDPRNPRHMSAYKTSESQSVLYHDGLLYSGDWAMGEITVFDASDLRNLKVLSLAKLDGYGDGVCVSGDCLFAATGHHAKSGAEELREGAGHGLEIFDVSDPRAPGKLSVTKFPRFLLRANDFWTPRVCGNTCFVADTGNGVFVLDVGKPEAPTFLGHLTLPVPPGSKESDSVGGIAVGDGVLYVAGVRTGLHVAAMPGVARVTERSCGRKPMLPAGEASVADAGFVTVGASARSPVTGLAVKGDRAYAACSTDGLKVFQLSDVGVTEVARLPTGEVYDVKVRGDCLYLAAGMRGLIIYRIDASGACTEVGRLGSDAVRYLWAPDGTDLVMGNGCGTAVSFFDVSDPEHPKRVWKHSGKGLLYGNYGSSQLVGGRYFACARHCSGFALYDLEGGSPKLVSYDPFPLCSQAGGVAAFGGRFLSMRNGGYALVDPAQVESTTRWHRFAFPGMGNAVLPDEAKDDPASWATFPQSEFEGVPVVEGSVVAVSNRMFRRCRVYNFQNPQAPVLLRTYSFREHQNTPSFWKGRLVFPGGYAGVMLEKESR